MIRLKHIYAVFLLFGIISCGTQRQLQKAYVGKPIEFAQKNLGTPHTVIQKDQEKIYIFEKEEELKSAEINQGRVTLDPMVTPKVLKTERYYFTVKNGVITKVKLEEEYER